MTAINIINKTILDLRGQKLNKSKINNALKSITVETLSDNSPHRSIIYDYDIIVGKFVITLWKDTNEKISRKKWHSFSFTLHTKDKDENIVYIDAETDPLFKNQPWANKQSRYGKKDKSITAKDLTDIIFYCNRINNLYAFS